MRQYIYITVMVIALAVAVFFVYMYLTMKATLGTVNSRYSNLLESLTNLQLINNKYGQLPMINVSAIYATEDGYAIVFTISNPENYTQFLYDLDITMLPYSARTYYVGTVSIPPLSTITYPVFVYFNSTILAVSTIYNFNQVAGGSETIRSTVIGPVYYALSTLPGSTITLSYTLVNGSTRTYSYIVTNFTTLQNSIYAYAAASDSWPSEVLLTYLAPLPFSVIGYRLIAPNGTVLLTCTSISKTAFPNGTSVNYIPTPIGQLYLPLYNASAVTTIHYWLSGYWDTFAYNVTAACMGSFILFSMPLIHYQLQVTYIINGTQETAVIPITYTTTSMLIWS
ncbi:hypothetical protein [Caldivirga maquilingensis]|uniref:Uncharacterized protein n=1 Tax=Caldivirga maquilingensis (strain ATCC 700844 / DSM 13496 / JCM 10307 / IC-167) TaxID=397948 RepID=A8M9M6_CALMQ|nr:hypothetical protein [Caldivirga maquilingensis]ABW00907.1 hypothetical protein Cmaq_0053 [Caldivirga maquilingensis IC-167]